MFAAILFVMYFEILPKKTQAMMDKPPNAILVYQTYFKLSAYAHLESRVAAWTTAGVRRGIGTVASSWGAVRNNPTKSVTEIRGSPASTAYVPT
jgi:hypothetical protein